MKYPTPQDIIDFNAMALEQMAVKKKDKHAVMKYSKISQAIEHCQRTEGDAYKKASVLLSGLVQDHPFASGNRRTALIAAMDFLIINGISVATSTEEESKELLKGVREGFYSYEHVERWLRTGKINGRKARDTRGHQGPL